MNRQKLQGLFTNKNEKALKKPQYDLQAFHIKFQNNESQASDASYESSLSSNEDKNIDDIQYFREEMSRFFINYPELIDNDLVKANQKEQGKSPWAVLAKNLLNQAKEQQVSLHGIAKRIAYYREKAKETDILDLIAKQKDLILKGLDEQASMFLHQNPVFNRNENDKRSSSLGNYDDDIYFSWKKRQEKHIIQNSRRVKAKPCTIHESPKQTTNSEHNKLNIGVSKTKRFNSLKTHSSNVKFILQEKRPAVKNSSQTLKSDANHENNKLHSHLSLQVKALFNFEPITDAGKQLLEEIKRENPSDEIAIKKTIVNFIAKYRQNLRKQMLDKSSIPQRLSKLHLEDSKELSLFFPIKKSKNVGQDLPLSNQAQEFLEILKEISGGHLMKYWKILQQKKL